MVRPPLGWTKLGSVAFSILAVLLWLGVHVAPSSAAEGLSGSAKASALSGFTVIALVTSDPDWLSKWNTTSAGVSFRGTDTLHAGDKATLAVFFSNAMVRNGKAKLECDVTIRHKSGDGGQKMPPTTCFDGPVAPVPNAIMLTELQIELSVDATDKSDISYFDIGVTDVYRQVRVPVSLTISDDPAGQAK